MEPQPAPTPEPETAPQPAPVPEFRAAASPVIPQSTPKSKLPKHYLTPMLVLFLCMIGAGAYLVNQNTDAPSATGDARPLAAPPPSKEDVAAQASFILKQYGGESANAQQRGLITRIGNAIATKSEAKDAGRTFRFTLLAEPDIINVFALPTGEVYVTTAFVNRMKTEGELAAALASGTAHALLNHRMEPRDPANAGTSEASVLKFSTAQETASDARALKIMTDAGYSPEAYLGMFRLLTEAYNAGANAQFFTTHPSADWRLSTVNDSIKKMYPQGVPEILSK